MRDDSSAAREIGLAALSLVRPVARLACATMSVTVMVLVASYVTVRVVPTVGGMLLSAADVAEDAALVVWLWSYVMPYLFACMLMAILVAHASMRLLSWSLSIADRFADSLRLWYDRRRGNSDTDVEGDVSE